MPNKKNQQPETPKTKLPDKPHSSIEIGGNVQGSLIVSGTNNTINRNITVYRYGAGEEKRRISAGQLLNACTQQVSNSLYEARFKYTPTLYVHRWVEREIQRFLDMPLQQNGPNCYLLVAPAGSGKTSLSCAVASMRVKEQPVLLLMGGSIFTNPGTGLLGTLQTELETVDEKIRFASATDCLQTLETLGKRINKEILIFLDAINEYDSPAQMRKAIDDLLRKTRNKNFKLVITCRDYYWGLFRGEFWIDMVVNSLPTNLSGESSTDFHLFEVDEYETALPLYLNHYEITGHLTGSAVEQCRHPLLLRFFCEAYRHQDIGDGVITNIRLKELFDRYWSRKLESIAERMLEQGNERMLDGLKNQTGDYLINIAAHMLRSKTRTVSLQELPEIIGREEDYDDPRSTYGRIRDEYIILEEKEHGRENLREVLVAFVYEEFMEYIMAQALLKEWKQLNITKNKRAILAKIEELTNKYEAFTQILGVIVYLSLMLKERHDIELWSLLLNKGEQWQNVLFEAIRKLPDDQLDNSVYSALEEILRTNNESLQLQVLNIIRIKRIGEKAPRSTAELISTLLEDHHERIRREAILALENMRHLDVILDVLSRTLTDDAFSVRRNTTTVLLKLDNPQVAGIFVNALRSQNNAIKVEALEALATLAKPEAQPVIIELLRDPGWEIRKRAADALAQVSGSLFTEEDQAWFFANRMQWERCAVLGSVSIMPVIAALRDGDAFVQEKAMETLLNIAKSEPQLLSRHLQSENNNVRSKIASLLDQLNFVPSGEIDEAWYHIARRDWKKCLELGESAIRPLVSVLKDNDWYTRMRSAELLEKLGWIPTDPESAAWLAVGVGDWRNCLLLGYVAIKPLIALLKDGDDSAQEKAAELLGMIENTEATKPLAEALHDTAPRVRAKAALALGKLRDKQALVHLFNALDDPVQLVHEDVINALLSFGDDALVILFEALKAEQPNIRSRSAKVLATINIQPATRELLAWYYAVRKEWTNCLDMGFHAVAPLITTIKDETDWITKKSAAKSLATLGADARRALIPLIHDADRKNQLVAIEILGMHGDPECVEHIAMALEDKDPVIRQASAEALGKLNSQTSVEALISHLNDQQDEVIAAAAYALGQIEDPRATRSLIPLLQSRNQQIRKNSKAAIIKIGQQAVPLLLDSMHTSSTLGKGMIVDVLTLLGESGLRGIVSITQSEDPYVQSLAASSLARLAGRDRQAVVQAIRQALEGSQLSKEAADNLMRLINANTNRSF